MSPRATWCAESGWTPTRRSPWRGSAAELDAALAELSAGLADAPEPPNAEDAETDDRVPALAGASAAGARRDIHSGSTASGPAPAQVGWRTVNTMPGHLTTYYFSPE